MISHPFIPSDASFPDFYCKYANIDRVREQGSVLINELLDNTPLFGGRRFVSVDVKVQHLRLQETTCLPGWHCDTISDSDAMHHLFIIGANRTEFKTEEGVVVIPENHFVSFGSDEPHRGPVTTVEEVRLLFRVTESNIVRGNRKFYDSYPHRFPTR